MGECTNMNKDIAKEKKKLIGIAKRKGIYENFGQKEFRKLNDKYSGKCGYDKIKPIFEFNDWAMNFDEKDIK